MSNKIRDLRREISHERTAAKLILDTATEEKRGLTKDEQAKYDEHSGRIQDLDASINRYLELDKHKPPEQREKENRADRYKPSEDKGVIGMEKKDIENYSILRAVRAHLAQDWSLAPLERDASMEMAKRLKRDAQSFFVPGDVLLSRSSKRMRIPGYGWQYRDMSAGTDSAGGFLIADELMADNFIDMLRNQSALQRAGAGQLTGLDGNLEIPKKTATTTGYWVAEDGTPTESQPTLAQVTGTPHTAGAYTDITRRLRLQSSIDVDRMVQADLAETIALLIDYAGLHGDSGVTAAQPDGVETFADVTSVVGGTNGAAPTWPNIVGLETAVNTANALLGRLAYITNAAVVGKLKTTEKATNTAMFIMNENMTMNGYPVINTNQVRSDRTKGTGTNLSTVFFGNWGDVMIGYWSGLDILVDQYTGSSSGKVRIVAFQDVDIMSRRDESFAAMLDADTS